ncbi:MAG: hypothetical protein QE484_19710 [Rhizobium sp.]|nr:hypothetical protein [Rhizobium sp.]
MWARLHKFLDRLESRIALFAIVQGLPVLSAGALSAWLASGVGWVSQFGMFGWWMAALVGALLSLCIAIGFTWLRNSWIKGNLLRKWGQDVDHINPMDPEFTRRRIKIGDLANPISKRISHKKFISCELMGPANIAFQVNNVVSRCNFNNCDIVVVRSDAPILNVLAFENAAMIDCDLWNCTIFIPQSMVSQFDAMNAKFVTLTGAAHIDGGPRER